MGVKFRYLLGLIVISLFLVSCIEPTEQNIDETMEILTNEELESVLFEEDGSLVGKAKLSYPRIKILDLKKSTINKINSKISNKWQPSKNLIRKSASKLLIKRNEEDFKYKINDKLRGPIRPSLREIPRLCKKDFDVGDMFHKWYNTPEREQLSQDQMDILNDFALLSACLTVNELSSLEKAIYNSYREIRSNFLPNHFKTELAVIDGDFLRKNLQPMLLLCDSSKNWGKESLCYKLLKNNNKLKQSIQNKGWTSSEILLYDRQEGGLIGFPQCKRGLRDCIEPIDLISSFNPSALGFGDCSLASMFIHGKKTINEIDVFTCPVNRLCGNNLELNLLQKNTLRTKWGDELSEGDLENIGTINNDFCNGGQSFRTPNSHGGISGFLSDNGCTNQDIFSNIRNSQNYIRRTMECAGLSNDPIGEIGGNLRPFVSGPQRLNGVPGCDPNLMEPSEGEETKKEETEEERKKREEAMAAETKEVVKVEAKVEIPVVGKVNVEELVAKAVKEVGKKLPGSGSAPPIHDLMGEKLPTYSDKIQYKFPVTGDVSIKLGTDLKTGFSVGILLGGSSYCPPDSGNCGNGCTAIGAQVNEDLSCSLGPDVNLPGRNPPGSGEPDPTIINPVPEEAGGQAGARNCNLGLSNRENSICNTVMCPEGFNQGSNPSSCCGIEENINNDDDDLLRDQRAQGACLRIACEEGANCVVEQGMPVCR